MTFPCYGVFSSLPSYPGFGVWLSQTLLISSDFLPSVCSGNSQNNSQRELFDLLHVGFLKHRFNFMKNFTTCREHDIMFCCSLILLCLTFASPHTQIILQCSPEEEGRLEFLRFQEKDDNFKAVSNWTSKLTGWYHSFINIKDDFMLIIWSCLFIVLTGICRAVPSCSKDG